MKQSLFMRSILALMMMLMSTITANAIIFEYRGLKYYVDSFHNNNTAEVYGYTDSKPIGSLVIPSVAHHIYTTTDKGITVKHDDSYTVTAISGFKDCTGITSATIPNTVTTIDSHAFDGCTGLTSLNIPNSVISINYWAFAGCDNLTTLTLGNSVKTIGECAFGWCSNLASVIIPNSVAEIGENAFRDCSGLTSVTIGNSVTNISDFAFYKCSGLITVAIPISVTSIGDGAFCDCSGLTSMTISNSVTKIGVSTFNSCSNLSSITIPSSVTIIDGRAFENCISLASVTIPNSVNEIGLKAFYGCSGLHSVTIGNSVTAIGKEAFYGCNSIKELNWNARHCSSIGGLPENQIENVTIGNEVEIIPAWFISGATKVTSVIIPNSVTSIGEYAFFLCSGLNDIFSHIEHPENVTLGLSVFINGGPKDACTLHVPKGTIPIYRECDQWKDFLNIVDDADANGDLSGDGKVDVSDVNIIIDMVLGKQEQDSSADLNNDGIVDVSDVNALIDIVLGK